MAYDPRLRSIILGKSRLEHKLFITSTIRAKSTSPSFLAAFAQLALFTLPVQGPAHEIVPPIFRVGLPTQLAIKTTPQQTCT